MTIYKLIQSTMKVLLASLETDNINKLALFIKKQSSNKHALYKNQITAKFRY